MNVTQALVDKLHDARKQAYAAVWNGRLLTDIAQGRADLQYQQERDRILAQQLEHNVSSLLLNRVEWHGRTFEFHWPHTELKTLPEDEQTLQDEAMGNVMSFLQACPESEFDLWEAAYIEDPHAVALGLEEAPLKLINRGRVIELGRKAQCVMIHSYFKDLDMELYFTDGEGLSIVACERGSTPDLT